MCMFVRLHHCMFGMVVCVSVLYVCMLVYMLVALCVCICVRVSVCMFVGV